MSEMPDDIRKAAREAASLAIMEAIRDERTGFAIKSTMHQQSFDAFVDAVSKAILAERTRCAAEAYNKGWSDCYDEPRPFFAAREAGLARYLKTIRGEA